VISSSNELLAALPLQERQAIEPHLKRIRMAPGVTLHEAGTQADKVYFPENGAISLVVELESGESIESALIGKDGAVGGFAALHGRPSLNKAIVQIESAGLAISAEQLRHTAVSNSVLARLIEVHNQFLHAQAQQAAACNAAHGLEARLARWLLRAHDICGANFLLTQESVAAFLGVRRTSVSLTAHALQDAGIIRYRRGMIEIVDLERLRKISCECHAALNVQRQRLMHVQPIDQASTERAG
jgi:CRP-like cAMP-binding protein